ncbi:MAG: GNAT family N-acetyltransferase [Nocardioides sp.]
MGRSQVVLREAVRGDAPFLAELWASSLRRPEVERRLSDVHTILDHALSSPAQQVLIAEYDDIAAGAVLLEVGTVSSLNLEPTVRVLSPSVAPSLQRRGVGKALMDAALAFAEEQGIATLATAVGSGARESNRFMARLALSPMATYRVAPVAAVRARLRGQRPGALRSVTGGRQTTRVVAARRSMRRSRATG